jgi:hypothetical protein
VSLLQDLRLLVQHLDDAARRVAGARQAASMAGPQLAAVLQGSQRIEPREVQVRIEKAERDTHRTENLLREAIDRAHHYGATL